MWDLSIFPLLCVRDGQTAYARTLRGRARVNPRSAAVR